MKGFKPLPKNHTFATERKSGKQVGKQPQIPGVIYFMVCLANAITSDDTDWIAVKIGLASGGEAEAYKVLCNHQTSNDGDLKFIRLLPVNRVGYAEAFFHRVIGDSGYSTIHGKDFKVPDRYKKFYQLQEGGGEWFVIRRAMLDKFIEQAKEKLSCGFPEVWADGWIGQSHANDPVKFEYDSKGLPRVDISGRQGRPIEEKALRFAWSYRHLTRFAPEGCHSITD